MPTTTMSRKGNLPGEVNTFVGRRLELTEIRRLLTTSSLVTLTGPGGVGKTRLVLRAAAGLARAFRDGAWLVELGEIDDPELISQAIASSLGIREQAAATPQQAVIDHLSDRSLLLVLDNCEHLIDAAARQADMLRRSAPDLRILATSREALGIQGEATIRVPPLPLPDAERSVGVKGLPGFDAVTLFTERAAAVMPEFAVTDQNRDAVVRIVRQLDGVPLALELAAARLRTLSPDELADRLGHRYELLTSGDRVGPARHQTLRLCVDWSYHQCSELEQQLWNRLAVFVGGFELDAVEGICAFGELEQSEVLDLVASLVEKSVLSRIDADERARFRMLESLREYGLERLHADGEYAEARRRHRDWYADLAVRFRAEWIGPHQVASIRRIDRELPNIRAAFDHSVMEPDDPALSLRITEALHLFWVSRGMLTEAGRWQARAMAVPQTRDTREQAELLYSAVALAGLRGDLATASELLAESRRVAGMLDDALSWALMHHAAGVNGNHTGNLDVALTNLRQAVEGFRELGDLNRLVEARVGMGIAAAIAGERDLAIECHEEVEAILRPRGEVFLLAFSLWSYGLAIWQVEPERATAPLEEALRLWARLGDLIGSVWCIDTLACIAAAQGEAERAAVLFGASSTLSRDFKSQSPALDSVYDESLNRARNALGERGFNAARARGAAMDIQESVAYALRESIKSAARSTTSDVLTRREREVAALIAEGLTNKAIAARLVISQRTAQGHVENILSKLGFTSRTQVAAWVAEHG